MTTMLERAARAVQESISQQDCYVAEASLKDGTIVVDGYVCPLQCARAVLMAVREPSEAMRVAGGECVWDEPGRWSHHVPDYEKDEAQAAWQAMIGAILSEENK